MKHSEALERLTRAFLRAQLAADEKQEVEDRGCFNFDTAIVRIPKVPSRIVLEAGARAGVSVERRASRRGEYWVWTHRNALCDRRSQMAQAACTSLNADKDLKEIPGASATMYFQLD
jgi:hypothetical protein